MHIWSELAWEEVRVGRMAEERTRCTLNECHARCCHAEAPCWQRVGEKRTRPGSTVRPACAEDAYMYL